jgi:hypothetical protein
MARVAGARRVVMMVMMGVVMMSSGRDDLLVVVVFFDRLVETHFERTLLVPSRFSIVLKDAQILRACWCE